MRVDWRRSWAAGVAYDSGDAVHVCDDELGLVCREWPVAEAECDTWAVEVAYAGCEYALLVGVADDGVCLSGGDCGVSDCLAVAAWASGAEGDWCASLDVALDCGKAD